MPSVRFEPELEAWLEAEADASGRSVSDIIHEAVCRLREQREGRRLGARLKRVAGVVDSGGGEHSRDTTRAFADLLEERDAERRKRPQ